MNAPAATLTLLLSIPLPGVKGRIDHMSANLQMGHLYVAALGNNTVEVIDLKAAKHKASVPGFAAPQGVLYVPKTDTIVVANGGNGRVDIFRSWKFNAITQLHFNADSDNVRFDPFTDEILVGHGDGAIAILDAKTGIERRNIALPAHPESFQLITQERKLFINLPDAGEIAVADPDLMQVTDHWKNPAGLSANFAMAVDPEHDRVFVAYRKPSTLATFDAKTGKLLSKTALSGDCDDLFFDAKRKRVYAVCGEGFVDVFDAALPGKERRIAKIPTAPRARTGFFIREKDRLLVAAPRQDASPAKILVFRAGS